MAEFATLRSTVPQAIATGPQPVVAMIHSARVGGGLEIASMCDMRICSASSRFGNPVKRLGLAVSYSELKPLAALVGRTSGPH